MVNEVQTKHPYPKKCDVMWCFKNCQGLKELFFPYCCSIWL